MKVFITIAALLVPLALGQSCPKEEGVFYFPDSTYCDRYVECRDGYATEQQCPDGLLFNDLVVSGRYPCDYPNDVDCGSRSKRQPAQSTENCPNAWGYFGSGSSSECGYFFNCVDGHAFTFNCPQGLAFSSITYRCEYPEDSPECDAAAYLGFSCPAYEDQAQVLAVGTPRYRSSRDCREFFLCVNGHPRVQSCDYGRVFNEAVYGCDEPENVQQCSNYYPADELKAIRERKAIEAERRERRKQEFEARRAELAQRRQGGYSN